MYCSSCGTAVTEALNYCKRCGNNLNLIKGGDAGKTSETPAAVGVDIFWTTVIGLGIILGGMIALKKLDFREALIVAYMIVSSIAFLGLFSLDVWRFIRLFRDPSKAGANSRIVAPDTKELDASEARALPEPVPSVIENTTRSLEPSYREQKPH